MFTAAIVDGLATGDADRDGDGAVSIEDLHKHVYERVRETKRTQTPLLWTFGIAGTLHIAQNPHSPSLTVEPPSLAPAAAEVVVDPGDDKAARSAHRRHDQITGDSRSQGEDRVDSEISGPGPGVAGSTISGRWRESRRRVGVGAVLVVVALLAAAVALVLRDGDGGQDEGDAGADGGSGGWLLEGPVGLAPDDRGGLYIAESVADRVSYFLEGTGSRTAGGASGDGSEPGDGGLADEAALDQPLGLAFADGSLHIADRYHRTVREVRDGAISRFAGGGTTAPSVQGGPAVEANLDHPLGVAAGSDGAVYISTSSHRVLRVDGSGVITVVAGNGEEGFGGDGGPAAEAALNYPAALAVSPDGNLYIADTSNNRIRRVDLTGDHTITTVAGNGTTDFVDDVAATTGALAQPEGIAVDADGVLYIADTLNNRIRRVDLTGDGTITTVAGNGDDGYQGDDGPAISASLNHPQGVAVGTLYIADTGNDRVRAIDPDGIITTLG